MQKYSELVTQILEKKGITDGQDIESFLNPSFEHDFHDPYLMRDMERACTRLFEAIDAKEKIVVYADYDCDGIPGAVIMQDLFKKIGYTNYEVYIPQRNSEGYGLNLTAIEQFASRGVKLLITIDLGITAVSEVAQAAMDGIDVIITDHHLPQAVLPRAYAILNPKVDNYPEKMLCGSGVVFKFVQGFIKKYGKENKLFEFKDGTEKWMLDMAGLATLSDMVPLLGENRAIAYFGLKVLRKSPRIGLIKLLSKMNIAQKYLTEDDIGFMVTPRLNAASRMDDPMRSFELLSTDSVIEGERLAEHLSSINDERKSIVATIVKEVKKKFNSRELKEVVVVGNPEWRIGVLGLIAGKITDEFKKPAFVWGRDENNIIKGSCRSDGSVSVVELMTEASEYFIDFGGHELAGGFTVHNEKIHTLEDALAESYTKVKQIMKGKTEVEADVIGDFSLISMENWRELEKLAPYGLANPKPVFLFKNVFIDNIRKFGKNGSGEHLEIIFRDMNKKKVKAISFFSGLESFSTVIAEGMNVSVLANFDLSRFRGREELRLRIVSILNSIS